MLRLSAGVPAVSLFAGHEGSGLVLNTATGVLYYLDAANVVQPVVPAIPVAKLQHARVSTGSVLAGGNALVTVTWATAFADANYTVTTTILGALALVDTLSILRIESITAAAVTIRVLNISLGALTGTIHIIGVHD